MSIIGWITGHDEKESDVYANFDKVDQVVGEINNISTSQVESARSELHAAMGKLQSSVANVLSIDAGRYDAIFDEVSSSISMISKQIESKANDIKIYSESNILEKLSSTWIMTNAKTLEGILGVGEDIADAAAGIIGWVGGFANEDFQNSVGEWIKKDHIHDWMSGFYESDTLKKSFFTEDSAVCGAYKLAGAVSGTILLSALGAGMLEGAGITATALGSTTTLANTAVAGLTTLGNTTESGLKQGKSYNESFYDGLKKGALAAGLAYGVGRWSERSQKAADIKKAEQNLADTRQKGIQDVADARTAAKGEIKRAEEAFNQLEGSKVGLKTTEASYEEGLATQQELVAAERDVVSSKWQYDNARAARDEAIESVRNAQQESNRLIKEAEKKLADVKSTPTSQYQGYTDELTNAGRKFGKDPIGTIKNTYTKAGEAVTAGKDTFATNLRNLKADPAGTISGKVGDIKQGIVQATKEAWTGIKNTSPSQIVAQAGTTVRAGVKAVANPGVVAQTINSVNKEIGSQKADEVLKKNRYSKPIEKAVEKVAKKATYENTKDTIPTPEPAVETKNPSETVRTNGNTSSTTSGGGVIGGGGLTGQFQPVTSPKTTAPVTTPTTSPVTTPTTTAPTTPTFTSSNTAPTTPKIAQHIEEQVQDTQQAVPTATETHTGGEYSATSGYIGTEENSSTTDDVLNSASASIDDIIKGNKYSRIPSSSMPILNQGGVKGSTVIPIASGLSAAGAAGLGAKSFLDNRKEKKEDDELDTEDWSSQKSVEIEKEEKKEETLEEDHFDFQRAIEE